MSTRQQATRRGYGRALNLWDPPEGAGEALVCLATTFTFDAAFFETECVGRFLNLDSHPSESDAVGYLIEREENWRMHAFARSWTGGMRGTRRVFDGTSFPYLCHALFSMPSSHCCSGRIIFESSLDPPI